LAKCTLIPLRGIERVLSDAREDNFTCGRRPQHHCYDSDPI